MDSGMSGTTEAFARVKIDALLTDAGWNLTDGSSVLFEHALPDGTQADYMLCDRQGRPMAALEAKRASTDPIAAQDQGRHYAEQLGVPFVPDPEDGFFVRDTLRFFELTEPTFRYPLRRAVEEDHLVPYRIYKAMTVKTAAKDGFEVGHGELDWSAMDKQTREEFEELFSKSDTITVDPRALERKFTIPERNRAMVREFRDAHEKGFMGRDGVRRWPDWGKTIVFAVTRRHAETLAEMFDAHFADLKPHPNVRYADFVVSDVGGGPAPDTDAIIKRFKDEDYPKILVSVNMLDTGFDCPEVVNLVMARFTGALASRGPSSRG